MAYLEPLDPPQHPSIPYRRIKRRARRGLVAVLALAVMGLSAGGLWFGYKLTSPAPVSGDVPLIHADAQPFKTRPADPGGMEIPNRNSYVFNQKGSDTTERLLPPPEKPLPRPTPPPLPPQAVQVVPTAPAAAPTATPSPAPPLVPPAEAAAVTPPAVPPAPAAATPAAPTVALAPPAAVASAGKGYRLQLGSVRSPEGAQTEWDRIKRQNSDLVGALTFNAERADLGDRGVFYRIQVGPVADASEADRLCATLRQRNVGCLIVKP